MYFTPMKYIASLLLLTAFSNYSLSQTNHTPAESWCSHPPRQAFNTLKEIQTTSHWFKVYSIAAGVLAIVEPYNFEEVISYLIIGKKKAMLFDTGMGLDSISSVIKQYNINILYIPHRGDIHHDHRAVFNASIVAARPVGNYSVKQIYAYETLSETEWAPPFSDDAFIPTYFVNIQDEINDKVNALMCYTGQIKEFPSSRSVIALRALAQYRGATVGFSSAEAFMLIRSIQS